MVAAPGSPAKLVGQPIKRREDPRLITGNGELITGTMSEYAVPKASMVPWYELDRTVTPTPVNPMGAKGAGEAGTIASTPAVANAVIDAVAHLGIKHIDMPLTPERVWRAIGSASA